MSVTAHDARIEVTGDDAATTIAVDFAFYDEADLKLNSVVIATGDKTLLVLDTNYSVSGGAGSTGTITMISPAALASTDRYVVTRDESLGNTFNPGATFNTLGSAAILEAINRQTMALQMLDEKISRCLKVPIGEPMESAPTIQTTIPNHVDRASEALTFDADGNATST